MMTETNEKEDCMKRNVWLTVHGEQQYEMCIRDRVSTHTEKTERSG